ncbi:MAG: DEAD/DEAH box helicase, partial [Planctomycetaceae bacterium]|nr:DEAD/DEAH box helicase [Planctomycetaceae bacterium]
VSAADVPAEAVSAEAEPAEPAEAEENLPTENVPTATVESEPAAATVEPSAPMQSASDAANADPSLPADDTPILTAPADIADTAQDVMSGSPDTTTDPAVDERSDKRADEFVVAAAEPEEMASSGASEQVTDDRRTADSAIGESLADASPGEVATSATAERAIRPTANTQSHESSTSRPSVDQQPVPATPVSSEKQSSDAAEPQTEEKGFRRLDLRPEVQQAVEELGYDTPTDVQAQIIPHLMAGRDVLAQSQTGTGKTAAFALPILSLVALPTKLPQVIVLTPTRELAMQVADSFSRYGQHLNGFRVAAVYGGTGYDGQIRQLRRGAPIVVGTPGRVIDLIKKGILDLSLIGCCVLDEADEMLNMGFLEDVEFVLQHTPEERQVALFSATMPGPIQSIAKNYQNDPVRISIKRKTMTAEAIRQRAVVVQHRDKLETLTRLLDVEETDGVIIFTRTREATVTVAEHLSREGLAAIALNGDMPQNVRERAIDQLKSGKLDILVATDVAARGLDVSRISHVFNYDVPQDSETYVHRIGRTGRAGRKGEAIILLSNSQRYKLKQIERVTRQSIEVVARPSAADINAARVARFKQKITSVMASDDRAFFADLLREYSEETGAAAADVASALAVMLQNGRPFLAEDRPRRERQSRQDDGGRNQRSHGDRERGDRYSDRDSRQRNTRPPRRAGRVEAGMERYRIEVGHQDNVRPGNIVGAVANEGGIEGEYIGPINIYDNYSTIDLPEGMPNDVYNVLRQVRVAGKPLQLKKATESDNHGDSSARRGGQRRSGQGGPRRFSGKGRSGKNRKFDGRKQRRHG